MAKVPDIADQRTTAAAALGCVFSTFLAAATEFHVEKPWRSLWVVTHPICGKKRDVIGGEGADRVISAVKLEHRCDGLTWEGFTRW